MDGLGEGIYIIEEDRPQLKDVFDRGMSLLNVTGRCGHAEDEFDVILRRTGLVLVVRKVREDIP